MVVILVSSLRRPAKKIPLRDVITAPAISVSHATTGVLSIKMKEFIVNDVEKHILCAQ